MFGSKVTAFAPLTIAPCNPVITDTTPSSIFTSSTCKTEELNDVTVPSTVRFPPTFKSPRIVETPVTFNDGVFTVPELYMFTEFISLEKLVILFKVDTPVTTNSFKLVVPNG
jgi:hypothetical protein